MLNVIHLVQSGGLPLIGIILFAEVGLFLGFFLPGDTLLIAAGIFAKQGKLSLTSLIIVAIIAAIAGDNMAYYIGRTVGPRLFKRDNSIIFRKKHVAQAENFYARYGAKTILIAHFLPIIRTFAPILAGVGQMKYSKFLAFDALGDSAWALTVTLVGYYIGSRIPNIDHYILLAVGGVVFFSLVPTLYHLLKIIIKRRARNAETVDQDKKLDQ